jgi:hypothetical protein
MGEMKYGKYIITEPKSGLKLPSYRVNPAKDTQDVATRLLWLDDDVVKGAFYIECVWYWQASDMPRAQAHTHDYDEVIALIGTNPEDLHDLGGEIELWLDDEKHLLTKSCLVYVPRGLKHTPMYLRRVDRPIFHFSAATGRTYK